MIIFFCYIAEVVLEQKQNIETSCDVRDVTQPLTRFYMAQVRIQIFYTLIVAHSPDSTLIHKMLKALLA